MTKQPTTQRPDLLQITTVSPTGKHATRARKGAVYCTVTKGFNEPYNQIAIEVQHSSGAGSFRTEHKRETALLNITFSNGQLWSGSFEDLRAALQSDLNRLVISCDIDQWSRLTTEQALERNIVSTDELAEQCTGVLVFIPVPGGQQQFIIQALNDGIFFVEAGRESEIGSFQECVKFLRNNL